MVWTTQRNGHNPGLGLIVTWEPFPENLTIPVTLFQLCGWSLPISVAVALAGVFAILINKIRKIMEIFE